MKERYLEIKFYYFVQNLICKFRYNINVLGIIEAICFLGDIDAVLIKQLVKQIRENNGFFVPTKPEVAFITRELGVPVRYINEHYNMGQRAQETNYKYAKEHAMLYNKNTITKVLPDKEFEELKKFMIILDRIQKL